MTNTPRDSASSPAPRATAGGAVAPGTRCALAIGPLNAIELANGDHVPEARGLSTTPSSRSLAPGDASLGVVGRRPGQSFGAFAPGPRNQPPGRSSQASPDHPPPWDALLPSAGVRLPGRVSFPLRS